MTNISNSPQNKKILASLKRYRKGVLEGLDISHFARNSKGSYPSRSFQAIIAKEVDKYFKDHPKLKYSGKDEREVVKNLVGSALSSYKQSYRKRNKSSLDKEGRREARIVSRISKKQSNQKRRKSFRKSELSKISFNQPATKPIDTKDFSTIGEDPGETATVWSAVSAVVGKDGEELEGAEMAGIKYIVIEDDSELNPDTIEVYKVTDREGLIEAFGSRSSLYDSKKIVDIYLMLEEGFIKVSYRDTEENEED